MSLKLELGTYRLTKTIQNPKPDKRKRHDWRKMTEWPRDILDQLVEEGTITLETVKAACEKVLEGIDSPR